ncbi:MAG: aldehyde dehydrogenase family protein, partial [Paracoccus sp. (in: a-proteobacteria)]|nr:aldehyde dehydrogenase family protein [Paracoccus sp. (in: a-proteobacteria)]
MTGSHLNLIGGQWHHSDELTENRNPSDLSDMIGLYAAGSAADLDQAAAAQPAWFAGGPQLRADLPHRIAARIDEQADIIGHMLAREEGKILTEAIAEVRRAAQIFCFYAGEALRMPGEALASLRPDIEVQITREPAGVVGLITPWNFLAAIPVWKIAPALAYGNAVVFKPAELVPGTAHLLARIIYDAGCPPGVFNLVMGRGSV